MAPGAPGSNEETSLDKDEGENEDKGTVIAVAVTGGAFTLLLMCVMAKSIAIVLRRRAVSRKRRVGQTDRTEEQRNAPLRAPCLPAPQNRVVDGLFDVTIV